LNALSRNACEVASKAPVSSFAFQAVISALSTAPGGATNPLKATPKIPFA
jgi:hypothetical protein